MNGDNNIEPVNILVSRDELLFVLKALEADFIPGLDPDPLGELTTEQQSLVLAVAGRALRARELARGRTGDELEIHTALLTMIGVCAYAQIVAFVYHWPADADAPQRYYGHIRGEDIVAHTRPEDALHMFSLLPAKSVLMDQIFAACHWQDADETTLLELSVSNAAFTAARETANEGNLDQAQQALSGGGADSAAVAALVETLADAPQVSILQTVKQSGDGSIQKRDFTLLQNKQHIWLVIAPENGSDVPLRVKTTSGTELRDLLTEWL